MVKLSLPLIDNTDNEDPNSTLPICDASMSIYDSKSCIKDSMFCSDDNPCPLGIACIDRVCQCPPNSNSYITLTPDPVRMYTIGCNFDTKRQFRSCRDYEYGVEDTCLLNYCSSEVPCYAGKCDNQRHVCVNITSSRTSLPVNSNPIITLGDDPFGTKKEGLSPVIIILAAAGGVMALAIVGCIVRTVSQGTRHVVGLVTGKSKGKGDSDDDGGEAGGAKAEYSDKHGDSATQRLQQQEGQQPYQNQSQSQNQLHTQPISSSSSSSLTRAPSKFTGAHYMPSPALRPTTDRSPFATPGPSPHLSPFANQNLDSPMLNPFRSRADTDASSRGSFELSNRPPVLDQVDDSNHSVPLNRLSSQASFVNVPSGVATISSEINVAALVAQPQSAVYEGFDGEGANGEKSAAPNQVDGQGHVVVPNGSSPLLSLNNGPGMLPSIQRSPSKGSFQEQMIAAGGGSGTSNNGVDTRHP
ncbi:hypothetical protein BGZ94_006875 [Podila epigama]|nr:hypothetical protein BGZ94_006875 [Podila epigama]